MCFRQPDPRFQKGADHSFFFSIWRFFLFVNSYFFFIISNCNSLVKNNKLNKETTFKEEYLTISWYLFLLKKFWWVTSRCGNSRLIVFSRCRKKLKSKNKIKSDLPTLKFRTMLPETNLSCFDGLLHWHRVLYSLYTLWSQSMRPSLHTE